MKKLFLVLIMGAMVFSFAACQKTIENPVIRMSTTTSVNDSGLMGYLLPEFEKATGYKLEITSAGTGAAIEKGVKGDADILLVHSKSQEEKFIGEGFDEVRVPFMYNYFVIVGPASDPAGVKNSKTAAEAFKLIFDSGSPFITRGDKSGTNTKELGLWEAAGVNPEGQPWYENIGSGMGAALTAANEKQAYTLSDKATYLAHENDLEILLETADDMMNTYSMIAISPKRFADTNAVGAQAFIDWVKSDAARKLIAEYGVKEYGQALFYNLDK
ncbi:MAG TPA: substrate-binding domain-containing protein [Anaerolineaceae bacterium]|nr:solute-binding protein [Chloroflexota bacterium]HNY84471.1 substrate-binding domain-containing protein [Anaerolineaceae bacterium]